MGISLLEESVSELLSQKQRAETLHDLLWRLSQFNVDGDDDFEKDGDSDSDLEEDDLTEFSTVTDPIVPASPTVLAEGKIEACRVGDVDAPKLKNEAGKGAKEFKIINGVSDNEVRRCIYLRNGVD